MNEFEPRTLTRSTSAISILAVWAAMLCLGGISPAIAQDRGSVGEYQVKAAFLYHFSKFVEWPPAVRGRQTIGICVLGNDPFGPALDFLLEDKRLRGKRFNIQRLGNASEAKSCHLLFVAVPNQIESRRALEVLAGSPVLTVGDGPGFFAAGGMIHMFVEESKVRFDINLSAAKRARITISAPLLRLARKVEGH